MIRFAAVLQLPVNVLFGDLAVAELADREAIGERRPVRRGARQGMAERRVSPSNRTQVQAAFFLCSIGWLSLRDPEDEVISIFRGFIASGISRTSSICSMPFSKLAPFTWT